ALVHHPRLLLRIEVLADVASDANELALPALEAWRALLKKIEQVLFGQAELAAGVPPLPRPPGPRGGLPPAALDHPPPPALAWGHHALPEVVVGALVVEAALLGTSALLSEIVLGAARVPVHALVHERVCRVQHALDPDHAMGILAAGHEIAGEGEVVEDPVG